MIPPGPAACGFSGMSCLADELAGKRGRVEISGPVAAPGCARARAAVTKALCLGSKIWTVVLVSAKTGVERPAGGAIPRSLGIQNGTAGRRIALIFSGPKGHHHASLAFARPPAT